jgi:CDP-glycerol glycerophosphotransferase (TagB/SpsB family)
MKIDRRNPRHWFWLALFAVHVLLAVAWRRLRPRRGDGHRVLLYGHKLNGNLAAIREHLLAHPVPGLRIDYLTLDPDYARELAAQGIPSVRATSPRCIAALAAADAIVSDHGLHALSLLRAGGGVRFFDVWHGIPFKGFDGRDFLPQHRFDEVWVASPLVAHLYALRFGFDAAKVRATGYARTDLLVDPPADLEPVRARLGLQATRGRPVVLFAPTWKQDAAGRSVFPFGLSAAEFFAGLDGLCRRTGAVVLFRTHLNSQDAPAVGSADIVAVPHARVPDTEAILLLADVLVCDWSSIAFDYLLLDRPTVFLDVPAPFAKGFSLGPEYRFGAIVDGYAAMLARIEAALLDPAAYAREFGARHAEIRERVYGDCADGNSSARCVARLRHWLEPGGDA